MNEVLRQERKLLLSMTQGMRLEEKLSAVLPPDPHNGPQAGYLVRSLYFDTTKNRDYREKEDGLELRRKIRLRIYTPQAAEAFLEMKQKQGGSQRKRSLKIGREQARRIASGDYTPLLSYREDFAAECYALMKRDGYLPRSIVEYRRRAYIKPENNIRITLDSQVRALEGHCALFFEEKPGLYPVLDPWKVILEVKYDHFLFSYIRDMIRSCNQSEVSVSKYCMARAGMLP